MAKPFDLSNMVDTYGSDVTIVRVTDGGFTDDGTIIPPSKEEIETKGIISVFADDTLEHGLGGKFDTDSIKFYTNTLIKQSDVIVHDGKEHTVFYHRDYSDLAVPYIYGLKRRDNR